MVAYLGSFGAGILQGYIQMRRLRLQEAYYDEMMQYYKMLMQRMQGGSATEREVVRRGEEGAGQFTYGGKEYDTSGAEDIPGGKDRYSISQMIEMAKKAGFEGNDAAHIAAIAAAESQGNPNALGAAGEVGLTQINPHAWSEDDVKRAHDPQGAFDVAYKVYQQQGWGAWSTDPSSKNFTPNNSMEKYYGTAIKALGTAPAEAKPAEAPKAAPAEAAPKEGSISPAGGPWTKGSKDDPKLYQTDKDGNIKSDTGVTPAEQKTEVGAPYKTAGLEWTGPPTEKAVADLKAHEVTPTGIKITGEDKTKAPPDKGIPTPEVGPELAGREEGVPPTVTAAGTPAAETPLPPERPKDLTVHSEAKPIKAIPEAGDRPYLMAQPGQRAVGVARSPQTQDPFWRPNPPLNTIQRQKLETEKPSPPIPTAPTALTQLQHNIQQGFTNARQAISKAVSGDTTPAAAAATGTTKPLTDKQLANLPPPPRPPSEEGETAPQGPQVNVPDVPPSRTDIPVTDPFPGGTGIPTQAGGQMQVAQAQPVYPAPKPRYEDQGDQGEDVSPAATLGARKGGPIWKAQTGGATPSFTSPLAQYGFQGSTTADPSQGFTEAQYVGQNPNAPYPNIASGYLTNPNYGTQLQADVSALTPAEQQYMAGQLALRSGNPYTNAPASMSNIAYANTIAPPAWSNAASAPEPLAVSPIPPQTTNTVANINIPPATTAVNPASGTANTSNTATGTPMTWATGQTGTITAPNTSDVATFGGQGGAGVGNYFSPYTNTQSTTGTNYGLTAADTYTNSAGYQAGGPVAYQDGGDVSPASLGAPPGMPMGGQGQQPIPPVYYNAATFSPYGAGVGRGVTYASAPTLVAQAAPTYRRGGMVGYADGGDVGGDSIADPGMEQASYDAAMISPVSYGMPGMRGMSMGGGYGGMRLPMRAPPGMRSAGGGMPRGPWEGEGLYGPDLELLPSKPPNVPDDFEQINDGQGNISSSISGAIASALHFFGSALGLDKRQGSPLPNDPMIQQNRRDFANKVPAAGMHGPMMELYGDVDPTGTLNAEMRHLGGLGSAYKWHMLNEDPEGAQRVAASMLMWMNQMHSEFGKRAIQAGRNGDAQGLVDNLDQASQLIPNGLHNSATINPATGNTFFVKQTDLNGKVIQQGELDMPTMLAIATHVADGSLFYQQLEDAAGRYDKQYAEIAKERRSEQQGDLLNRAVTRMYGDQDGGGGGGGPQQGAQPQPRVIPVTGQGGAGAQPSLSTVNAIPPGPGQGPMQGGVSRPGATTGAPTVGAGAPPSGSPEGSAAAHAPPGEPGPEAAGYIQDRPGSQDISLINRPGEVQVDYDAAKAKADAMYKRDGRLIYDRVPQPDTTGMDKATAAKALNIWATENKNRQAEAQRNYNAELSAQNRQQEDLARQRNLRQTEEFTTRLHGAEAEQADIRSARAERNRQLDAASKEAEKERVAGISARPEKDIDTYYTTTLSATGAVSGREPMDHLADALGVTATGDAKLAAINANFGKPEDARRVAEAMRETYAYSKNVSPDEVDDAIAGLATGKYGYAKQGQKDVTGWGPDRTSLAVDRKDGTYINLTIPNTIIKNLGAVYDRTPAAVKDAAQKAEAGKPKQQAIPLPAPPSPIPGAGGPAPQGGFNAPPPAQTPEWWKWFRRYGVEGGGQPPPFGVPPAQPQRGYP